MRRLAMGMGMALLLPFLSMAAMAQQDKVAGRWEGKISSMQGERPTAAVFKKEGEGYTGKTLGLRPGTEVQLKDIKVNGDTVTAIADIETPQATLTVNYSFKLDGETMKGQGSLDFGGQAVTFDVELKRVSLDTEAPLVAAGQGGQAAAPAARPVVQQPQQKQSPDYFAGQWTFKYLGRESALGPAPREGTVTYTKRADGKSLDAVIEGKTDAGAYRESAVIVFDEANTTLTFTEKLANGVVVSSKGDWSSPISIKFTVEPINAKGQRVALRRHLSVVSAHSFTLTEELSEDGGPFVRLGSAVFSKVGAK